MSDASSTDAERMRRMAALARLHIDESEADAFASQLARIIAFADQMEQACLDGVDPMYSPTGEISRLRSDQVKIDLDRAELQGCAPTLREGQHEGVANGFYLVPKVIE